MSQYNQGIERTPEYVKFMKDLKEFHDKKGWVLNHDMMNTKKTNDLQELFYKQNLF